MAKTLISLGANLGNPRQVMQHAGEMILRLFGASNVAFSRLYRTPAVGGPSGQDDFFNAVATIDSNESAFGVWQNLNAIEQALGRQRRDRWEARRIDLDVLLHNDERHWTPTLKVPHPRMVMRTFVLEPACEIAPTWIEPVTGQTIESLSQSLLQLSAHTLDSSPSVHILVVSENIERSRQIAEAILETSHSMSTQEPYKAANLQELADNRLIVQLNSKCHIMLQSVTPLKRPISKSQIDDLRYQFDHQIAQCQATKRLNLLVFAGASPDPSLIHWEDYCRGWAELLGLVHSCEFKSDVDSFRKLPKYLLAADDPKWAAHELRAAMTAMTCPIQPCGAFFDV